MTLPDERYAAVLRTRQFLLDLCNPQKTPRIPKDIRKQAVWCLRHYPDTWEMQSAAQTSPGVFQERMEPVTRMIMQYQQEQKEDNG